MSTLAAWHRGFPGRLSGSIYAAAPDERAALARTMSESGLSVHADVMAVAEGLPAGVDGAELRAVADAVHPARIDVHLIGSTAFVDDALADVLGVAPRRVFLPWAAFDATRAAAIRAAGATAWIALWDEWDGAADPGWGARPDGVLVMLIEPGTKDRCHVDRVHLVAVLTARYPDLPVMVDGGVTEEIASLCVTAGVEEMVVGRALLNADRKEAM
jgi:pentose-5-phosphate-3-epimerase